MHDHPRSTRLLGAIAAGSLLALSACTALGRHQRVGAPAAQAGATTIGRPPGRSPGPTARDALLGAVIGGTAGSVIGREMDRQAEELRQGITGATVERIGEGIRVTFPAGLLYDDVGSDRVRPTASETLRSFARSVGGYPNTELLVVGYADADGTVIYDKDLSERRARSVSEYLAREGVDPGRVHESGRGEAEPVASGGTEAGRRQNRRVEVAIFASERYRSEMKARSATGSR